MYKKRTHQAISNLIKPIIEIKNLSAGYDGRTVLPFNLSIYKQDFPRYYGVRTGSKTTLIRVHPRSV